MLLVPASHSCSVQLAVCSLGDTISGVILYLGKQPNGDNAATERPSPPLALGVAWVERVTAGSSRDCRPARKCW